MIRRLVMYIVVPTRNDPYLCCLERHDDPISLLRHLRLCVLPVDCNQSQSELEKADGCEGKYTVGLGQNKLAFVDDR